MAFVITAAAIDTLAQALDGNVPWKFAGACHQQASRTADQAERESWELLAMAFTGGFKTSDPRDPYTSPASTAVNRANAPELTPIIQAITSAAIRARLADLVWLRARDPSMGQLAMTSFLEAAQVAEAAQDWLFCGRFAERSARLTRQLSAASDAACVYLRHLAETYQDGSGRFITMEAVAVLADLRAGGGADLALYLRNLASTMVECGEFHVGRLTYDQMIRLARMSNDRTLEREGHLGFARSYELEAEREAKANVHGRAAEFYQRAIVAYQQAGSSVVDVDRRNLSTTLRRVSA